MSVFTTVFRIHWKFFIVLRFRLKIFRSNVFPEKYRHQIRNLSKPEFRNRNTRITHLWSLLWCIRCWIGTGLVNSNYKVGYCHFTWSHLFHISFTRMRPVTVEFSHEVKTSIKKDGEQNQSIHISRKSTKTIYIYCSMGKVALIKGCSH